MSVITLGGLTGGGGRIIGPIIAKRLGYDYVDRLVLIEAAREIGSTVEALHAVEQRALTHSDKFAALLQRLLKGTPGTEIISDPYFAPTSMPFLTEEFEDMPKTPILRAADISNEDYIRALGNVMNQLADQGNVVLVGRGSSLVLRERDEVFRVGAVAELDERIRRIMDRYGVDLDKASEIVTNRDGARAQFHKQYFGVDNPDDPHLYHLVVNTSDLSIDDCCDIIVNAYTQTIFDN